MSEEVEIIEQGGFELIYEQNKAEIDVQITTAKAYPRNLKRATDNIVAIVTMDQETAQTCGYALPRGGKTIAGPSVHLAKIIVQQYGNMRVDAKVVNIDGKHVTSQAVAFDLENNVAVRVEVKRSIMTKSGRMNDDMITVTGNAANSIAMRNAIFAVVPKAIVDKAYKASRDLIIGDVSDANKLLARKKSVFDKMKGAFDISEKEILSAIQKPSFDLVTADDIATLVGISQAIADGDTTVEMAFKKAGQKPEQIDKEEERVRLIVDDCLSLAELEKLKPQIPDKYISLYEKRKKELNGK